MHSLLNTDTQRTDAVACPLLSSETETYPTVEASRLVARKATRLQYGLDNGRTLYYATFRYRNEQRTVNKLWYVATNFWTQSTSSLNVLALTSVNKSPLWPSA